MHLSKHLNTHTKPFRCGTCPKGFALRLDLGRHIRSQHRTGNEQYRCNVEHCVFTSSRKDNLRRHQTKAHGPTPQGCPVLENDQSQSPHQQSGVLGDAKLYSVSNLMRVAASGDLDRLESFLNAGLTVETRADDHSTVIHCASRASQTAVVKYLVMKGARLDVRNDKRRLPIHEAVLSNSPETLQYFLERMTQEELHDSKKELERYLARSGNPDVIDVYQTRLGSDFTDKDVSKKLSFAVRTGHYSLVTALLDDPNVNGNDKITRLWPNFAPIHLAAMLGRTKVMECLIAYDHINVNLRDSLSRQALQIAASNGHTAIVKQLIGHPNVDVNCQDEDGTTPLHYAASNGNWKIASLLLEHPESMEYGHRISSDVPPISLSFSKEDLLHRLLQYPDFGGPNKILPGNHRTMLNCAAKKGVCEVIELLLAYPDIDLKVPNAHGETPLMTAAKHGKLEAVRLLLQHKDIDVNQRDEYSYWTPLKWARFRKHDEVVVVLLSHGAIDYDAKALTTVPIIAPIDDLQNTTLQPDHDLHFDAFDDDMDDISTEALEEFLGVEEGMEE